MAAGSATHGNGTAWDGRKPSQPARHLQSTSTACLHLDHLGLHSSSGQGLTTARAGPGMGLTGRDMWGQPRCPAVDGPGTRWYSTQPMLFTCCSGEAATPSLCPTRGHLMVPYGLRNSLHRLANKWEPVCSDSTYGMGGRRGCRSGGGRPFGDHPQPSRARLALG